MTKNLNYYDRVEGARAVPRCKSFSFMQTRRKETWDPIQPCSNHKDKQSVVLELINIWKVMDETGRHDIVQLDESSDGLPIIQTTRRPDNKL
jgi:hypothetical protein